MHTTPGAPLTHRMTPLVEQPCKQPRQSGDLNRAVSRASNRDQKRNRYPPLLMETPELLSESDTPSASVR